MKLLQTRSPWKDVSDTVDVTCWQAVFDVSYPMLERHFTHFQTATLERAFRDFDRLYRGEFPRFHACETAYHDSQHVLDVTLAMARLIDGYEQCHGGEASLGGNLALLGMIVALYHDAGYIRRRHDSRHRHGAEYTRTHVSRSARFLQCYLPPIGLSDGVSLARELVHFTGYEKSPREIATHGQLERRLGHLVGTADVIAQMADIAYLEKCRDRLYPEFIRGGMTRETDRAGRERILYSSADDLLLKTPGFVSDLVETRLIGCFDSAFRYAGVHFGGENLYMDALLANQRRLQTALDEWAGQGESVLPRACA